MTDWERWNETFAGLSSLFNSLQEQIKPYERYVRPVTWEDTYEGYLISELYNPLYKRKIIEDMY